jgi:hypothetical protein
MLTPCCLKSELLISGGLSNTVYNHWDGALGSACNSYSGCFTIINWFLPCTVWRVVTLPKFAFIVLSFSVSCLLIEGQTSLITAERRYLVIQVSA